MEGEPQERLLEQRGPPAARLPTRFCGMGGAPGVPGSFRWGVGSSVAAHQESPESWVKMQTVPQ